MNSPIEMPSGAAGAPALALALWGGAWLLHLVIWRIRMPARQTRALFAVFGGVLAAGLLANAVVPELMPVTIEGTWACLQLGIFYVVTTLSYIEFYTALEDDSPSCTLLLHALDAGDDGCTREELDDVLTDDFVSGSRLQSLVTGRLMREDDGIWKLTTGGRRLAKILDRIRRIYRLPLGG